MLIPIAPAVIGVQLIVAVAADEVPTIDIRNTCRQAAAVTAGASAQSDIEICMSSEQKARDQLVRNWRSASRARSSASRRLFVLSLLVRFDAARQARSDRA